MVPDQSHGKPEFGEGMAGVDGVASCGQGAAGATWSRLQVDCLGAEDGRGDGRGVGKKQAVEVGTNYRRSAGSGRNPQGLMIMG